jgi:hypothetical protein
MTEETNSSSVVDKETERAAKEADENFMWRLHAYIRSGGTDIRGGWVSQLDVGWRELRLLERIPGRIGEDQVAYPRNAHDDLANAVCGCLRTLSNYLGYDTSMRWVSGDDDDDPDGARAWRLWRFRNHLLLVEYGFW